MLRADIDITTARLRLAQALDSKHALAIGKQVRVRSYSIGGNNMIEYTAATMAQLDAYITYLRQQIAILSGGRTRRPIYFAGM
jgi:hypothetical protein